MSEPGAAREELHGGRLVARRLRAAGVGRLFTLSGGHLFSLYDGCRAEGIDIVDVRHEATAAFAAEGHAKVTREIGVCAVTAGPGVTNAMSPLASARANHSPMLLLSGRAPAARWGQGSLQEIDHVPFVAPLTKFAATPGSPAEIPALVERALSAAIELHGGPAFVDLPLDYVFMSAPDLGPDRDGGAEGDIGRERDLGPESPGAREAEPSEKPACAEQLEWALELLGRAQRPVLMAGSDLYWARGEGALRDLVEGLRIPVCLNGLARGCLPADHELFLSRVRGRALREADVALLVGHRWTSGSPSARPSERIPGSWRWIAPSPVPDTRASRLRAASATSRPRCGRCWRAPGRPHRPSSAGSRPCARRSGSAGRGRGASSRTSAPRFIRCASTESCAGCSTVTRS